MDNRMKKVGKICRDTRIDYGDTLNDLAKKWKVDASVLSRFERGQKNTAHLMLNYMAEYPTIVYKVEWYVRSDKYDKEAQIYGRASALTRP